MVKADANHDYYADLEVPATAEIEEIKKSFRHLAKLYHPDRNPGHEVDVVPKFQAVQAANEILSDPQQRAKYDLERAKLNRPRDHSNSFEEDPYRFRKPTNPQPGTNNAGFPFPGPRPKPKPAPSFNQPPTPNSATSTSGDKFKAFNVAAGQQTWDRTRFAEEAARADAQRGFQHLRAGGVPSGAQSRSARPPTAQRPASDNIRDGGYAAGGGPSFPTVPRSASFHKMYNSGARPDEPTTSRASAHAYYRERQPKPGGQPYAADGGYSQSPTFARPAPAAGSPLRHTRSSGFDEPHAQRPNLERVSSRYSSNTGEKTDIHGPGLTRSASVRHTMEEHGPFGNARPHSHSGPPRHHSSSPKYKGEEVEVEVSESSSSDDEPVVMNSRPKAQPRKPRPTTERMYTGDEALTGHFPSKNYTTLRENRYDYPPPENGHSRQPFPNMTSLNDVTSSEESEVPNSTHQRDHDGPNVSSRSQQTRVDVESTQNRSHPEPPSGFSATHWHDQFVDGDDFFRPTESQTLGRKSPSKPGRSGSKHTGRPRGQSKSQDRDARSSNEHITPNAAAQSSTHSIPEENFSRRPVLESDKLAPKGFPTNGHVPNGFPTSHPTTPRRSSIADMAQTTTQDTEPFPPHPNLAQNGDAMDLDESEPSSNVSPATTLPRHRTDSPAAARGPPSSIDLNDLAKTAPFTNTTGEGLKNMQDIASTLPFESKPALRVELGERTQSSTNPTPTLRRPLLLPKPPPRPHPPADKEITQQSWEQYVRDMNVYMVDWNSFNYKMIEHFRIRQEIVNSCMMQRWISAMTDGPTANDFDSRPSSTIRAGYGTYMAWLEDDAKCRRWWEVACENHRKCFEDLGKTRDRIKSMTQPQSQQQSAAAMPADTPSAT